jgi:hypothetical protein
MASPKCYAQFRANHICAVRIFLAVWAGCILGYYVPNRGAILLDCCDPISEPVSERFVFFDLARHGFFGRR